MNWNTEQWAWFSLILLYFARVTFANDTYECADDIILCHRWLVGSNLDTWTLMNSLLLSICMLSLFPARSSKLSKLIWYHSVARYFHLVKITIMSPNIQSCNIIRIFIVHRLREYYIVDNGNSLLWRWEKMKWKRFWLWQCTERTKRQRNEKWNVILIQVFIVVRLCMQLWNAVKQWHVEYRRIFKLKVTITNMYTWPHNLLKYTSMWQPMYIEAYRRKGSANNFRIQKQKRKQTEAKTQVGVRCMHMESQYSRSLTFTGNAY